MTSAYPIPVTQGMSLSFWCWHDARAAAVVEVSSDGRSRDILDTFTESSEGWVRKEYDLSDYVGQSIFVRFRTPASTGHLEFYIDDIYPIARFGTVATLSDSITRSNYDVTERSEGDYYYRVRGHNAERGWGDFSPLNRVKVVLAD